MWEIMMANTAWSAVLYITIANVEVCCICCYCSVYIFITLHNTPEVLTFVMLQWVTFMINMLCWNCKYRSHTWHCFLCTLYTSSFIACANISTLLHWIFPDADTIILQWKCSCLCHINRIFIVPFATTKFNFFEPNLYSSVNSHINKACMKTVLNPRDILWC